MAQKTTKALSDKEVIKILGYVKQKYKNALLLEVNTGLRISDAIKLKYSDIANGKLEIIEKKTKKPQITKINKDLVKYLNNNRTTTSDYLFLKGEKDIEIECKNFIRSLQKAIIEACDMENIDSRFISTHSFRKTFATKAYRETKDILIVKGLLNHSDVSVTQRYIGVNKDEIDSIREKTRIGF